MEDSHTASHDELVSLLHMLVVEGINMSTCRAQSPASNSASYVNAKAHDHLHILILIIAKLRHFRKATMLSCLIQRYPCDLYCFWRCLRLDHGAIPLVGVCVFISGTHRIDVEAIVGLSARYGIHSWPLAENPAWFQESSQVPEFAR